MVKVSNSSGKGVIVEITGIAETKRMLEKSGQMILNSLDISLLQSSNLIQAEVQESIIGNRAEPKSVDSGKLGNSITVKKEDNAVIIYPKKINYGNGVTTEDVALYMEYGTSKIGARYHFKNTRLRNEKKVKDIFEKNIKKST